MIPSQSTLSRENRTFCAKNARTTIHTSHYFSGHGQHIGTLLCKPCGGHPAIAITSTSERVKVMDIRGMRHRKTGCYIRGLFPQVIQDSGRAERSQDVENPWYDKTAVTPQDGP